MRRQTKLRKKCRVCAQPFSNKKDGAAGEPLSPPGPIIARNSLRNHQHQPWAALPVRRDELDLRNKIHQSRAPSDGRSPPSSYRHPANAAHWPGPMRGVKGGVGGMCPLPWPLAEAIDHRKSLPPPWPHARAAVRDRQAPTLRPHN